MKRTLVIGDIHGALKALVQVLERCEFNPKEDRLIFLGDYADSWPETAELIQYLIDLKKTCEIEPIFLLGNHDEWLKFHFSYGFKDPHWVNQGGQATLDSYYDFEERDDGKIMVPKYDYIEACPMYDHREHHKFLVNCLNYYIDDNNNGFVHAGYMSEHGLGHDSSDIYYWYRDLLYKARSGKLMGLNLLKAHNEVFIGHTACDEYDGPEHVLSLWNLDTGCGWSGKLTIMDVETKEFWQSDLIKELYPGVKGR